MKTPTAGIPVIFEKPKLTPKQRRFVDEYLVDFNASAAVRRCKWKLTRDSAGTVASRMLQSVAVQHALEERMSAEAGVTRPRIVAELARLAFSKITDFMQWDDNGTITFTSSHDLTLEQAAAICSITVTDTKEGRQLRVKLHDKQRSLSALARIYRMLPQDGGVNIHVHNPNEERGDPLERIIQKLDGIRQRGTAVASLGVQPIDVTPTDVE